MSQLQNKIALVTGGNSGIGLGIARRFVAEGAKVVITARRKQQLDEAVKELGENAVGIQADVTRLTELDQVFSTIRDKYGRLDVVVANAGGGTLEALGEIKEESFDIAFNTNVKGVVFTVQKALPLLSKGSSVILIGSSTSVMGTPAFNVYSATKAAVRNLVRSWVYDLKGKDIRVNVLSPGPTVTPALLGISPGNSDELLKSFADQTPVGRVADTSEIASAALFLATKESSFVHGAELFVDGGIAQV